jgi:hypothetical protein
LNPKCHPITGDELMRRMVTIGEKYSVQWQFTPKAECGRRIVEILSQKNIDADNTRIV